ncbi:LacI family DNA-binding transcriptional regulator [Salana multivorans]|uniref:LacI family DNA-binding transcriptional regulator n=1 Tax=Salana multivorans TaxID=120377 RepID=UPI00249282D1|nr:LacI family DNA-binding transcriptional regulator [Salana multivorans]
MASPSGRATMKDVARLAGVGVKTVSRVVNGEPYVSEETRDAVERAIRQLRFQRNASAASLRHGQSRTIGLIVEDIAEPFQGALVQAVEHALAERSVLLFTTTSAHDPERERSMVRELISRRVDGLLVLPVPQDHSFLTPEFESGLPVVFVDRRPGGIVADLVASDNRGGTRAGTEYLVSRGHRRIAYLGDREAIFAGQERLLGYRDALDAAGIVFDPWLVATADPGREVSEAVLRELMELAAPPTALVTGNSLHTIATLRSPTFQALDLAHVAFDEIELQDLFRRPLDVVAQDPERIGLLATEILLDRIQGDDGPPREVRVPTQLRVRS